MKHAVAIAVLAWLSTLPAGARSERVLFIGNSLTAANDLPAMIAALVRQVDPALALEVRTIAFPDFGLEEHWNDGRALRTLRDGKWTTVVLQQGPSSLPESQRVLRDYARRFGDEARRVGARVFMYGVWPPRSRLSAQEDVTAGYARAAADIGATLVPVGEGWRAVWTRYPTLELYGTDGFHPSRLGTYLAALMFAQRLTGRSPVGWPAPTRSNDPALQGITLDGRALLVLQQAAAEANGATRASPAAAGS